MSTQMTTTLAQPVSQPTVLTIGYDPDAVLKFQCRGKVIFRDPEDVVKPEHIGGSIKRIVLCKRVAEDKAHGARIQDMAAKKNIKLELRGSGLTSLREALAGELAASSSPVPAMVPVAQPNTALEPAPVQERFCRTKLPSADEASALNLQERIQFLEVRLSRQALRVTQMDQLRSALTQVGEEVGSLERDLRAWLDQGYTLYERVRRIHNHAQSPYIKKPTNK